VLVLALDDAGAVADEGGGAWRLAQDTLFYSDSDNVIVVSPQAAVHRSIDDDGGEVGARVVIDAVSAASVDVVSQATQRFFEVRTEANLDVSKAIGKTLPGLSYRYSHEPDYDSHGFGGSVKTELGSSDTTLSVGYNLSLDTVGYTGTPTSAFSRSLTSNTVTTSLTQVLNPTTLIRSVYTLSLLNGYMEKPYRFVPLFDADGIAAAEADGVKLDLSTFDRYRLATRPPEEVPDQRVGHAVAGRFMRYLEWLPGSLRADYRFFADSWGVMSHTVEGALQWKVNDQHTLSGYARFYFQQGADFWQREYVVKAGEIPQYRTMDRELSNYWVASGGVREEWKPSSLSLYLDAFGMETVYSDYLFLTSRFALVLQGGLRWQL
jgi:hypothetical protein